MCPAYTVLVSVKGYPNVDRPSAPFTPLSTGGPSKAVGKPIIIGYRSFPRYVVYETTLYRRLLSVVGVSTFPGIRACGSHTFRLAGKPVIASRWGIHKKGGLSRLGIVG